jgi:hypothetical protein
MKSLNTGKWLVFALGLLWIVQIAAAQRAIAVLLPDECASIKAAGQ